jgi:hypothetical protein
MSIGIKNIFVLAATQTAASATPVAVPGMTIPIAANQTLKVHFHGTVTVGATGGIRLQITVPTGGVLFNNDIVLDNTVAPLVTPFNQASSAAFANALANAGTHFVDMECTVVNGATAGSVAITFAQNTTDALTATLLRGSYMETTGGAFN